MTVIMNSHKFSGICIKTKCEKKCLFVERYENHNLFPQVELKYTEWKVIKFKISRKPIYPN